MKIFCPSAYGARFVVFMGWGRANVLLDIFCGSGESLALMWMGQPMEAERACKGARDCHLRSTERSVTSDGMSPRLIELHHGTSRDQPGCSIFPETVIPHLFAFMS